MINWFAIQTEMHCKLKVRKMDRDGQQINLEYHRQRARLHLWQDGIFEILAGIGCIGYGLILVLQWSEVLPASTQIIVEVLFAAVIVTTGLILFRQTSEYAKIQITYPRSGYVQPRQAERDLSFRRVLILLLLIPVFIALSIGVSWGIIQLMGWLKFDGSLLLMSMVLAFPALAVGRRVGRRRFYWLALGMVLIGLCLTVAQVTGTQGLIALLFFDGLLISVTGSFVLWRFLQNHPMQPIGDVTDDGF